MGQTSQTAAGNILVSSFVSMSTTLNNQVVQSTSNSVPIFGISGEYSDVAPTPGANNSFHAVAGEPCLVYTVGDVAMLTCGSGGSWACGDLLTTDGTGNGVTATSGQWYGAQALEAASLGACVQVKVVFGQM